MLTIFYEDEFVFAPQNGKQGLGVTRRKTGEEQGMGKLGDGKRHVKIQKCKDILKSHIEM